MQLRGGCIYFLFSTKLSRAALISVVPAQIEKVQVENWLFGPVVFAALR
jgi:hypothetical protein